MTAPERAAALRYVALGDSYTIGTAVDATQRWPERLAAATDGWARGLSLIANLGVNGYTSADLIRDELPAMEALAPGFVSVLIGVNDVVQGVPLETYEANVTVILDTVLAKLPPDRVITIAIPDYTVTPAGADYGEPGARHDGIVANNAAMARLAGQRGIAFVDIFDISLEAVADQSLVAADGLHPSGGQYDRWLERIRPVVDELLAR